MALVVIEKYLQVCLLASISRLFVYLSWIGVEVYNASRGDALQNMTAIDLCSSYYLV